MYTDKKYNIVADQAATYELAITWLDPSGNPVNLTGYSARMQVRLGYAEPNAVIDISSDTSNIVLGGTAGTIHITVPAVDMGFLKAPQTYVYDLRLQNGPTVTRLIEGAFQVVPAVTIG